MWVLSNTVVELIKDVHTSVATQKWNLLKNPFTLPEIQLSLSSNWHARQILKTINLSNFMGNASIHLKWKVYFIKASLIMLVYTKNTTITLTLVNTIGQSSVRHMAPCDRKINILLKNLDSLHARLERSYKPWIYKKKKTKMKSIKET